MHTHILGTLGDRCAGQEKELIFIQDQTYSLDLKTGSTYIDINTQMHTFTC